VVLKIWQKISHTVSLDVTSQKYSTEQQNTE